MCVLRVSGKRFDPLQFLAGSKLKPYAVFRAGEPRFASQSNGQRHEMSGFKVKVSRSSWDGLGGQVADAIAFLKKHKRSLSKLRSIRDVEDITLDFPLDLRIDRKNVFVQFDCFPPELVSLAGSLGCGLELSIYPRDLEELVRARRKSAGKRPNGRPPQRRAKKASAR
jgi:hypothetical protein